MSEKKKRKTKRLLNLGRSMDDDYIYEDDAG
jgi:hypothetical protein